MKSKGKSSSGAAGKQLRAGSKAKGGKLGNVKTLFAARVLGGGR